MELTRDDVIATLTGPGQRFEIAPREIGGATVRAYRNAPATLRDVLLESTRFADREFLVYDDLRWTFAHHLRLVAELAGHLNDTLGITKGDRVGIAMRNFPEWSVAFWATQAIGAVAVPLNAWWSADELSYAIRDSGMQVLFVDGERLARLELQLADLELRRVVVVRSDRDQLPPAVDRWDAVCTGEVEVDLPSVELGPDDLSTIVYTSGTTGTPKGAMHVHRNHCTSVMSNLFAGEVDRVLSGRPAETTAQPAALLTFPLFHIAGLVNLYLPISTGSKVVLLYKWDVERAVDLLLTEGITSTVVVPTVLRELLDSERLQAAGGGSLVALAAGGSVVPAALVRRIGDDFSDRVSPANGYGLTETTAGVISTSGADYLAHPDSIGRPFVVVDIRVVAADGRDCEDDEVGELWVRGPNVVPGYWNNPRATADAFSEGWFHTGDLGRRDADGRYYIVDRLKDVVIRGGENVYCAEVEASLVDYPGLADVAVIGVRDERLGEEVVAVVRWAEDGDAATRQVGLVEFARERLAYFKVPTRIVDWPTELPRTVSGKVLKRDLRDQIEGSE